MAVPVLPIASPRLLSILNMEAIGIEVISTKDIAESKVTGLVSQSNYGRK